MIFDGSGVGVTGVGDRPGEQSHGAAVAVPDRASTASAADTVRDKRADGQIAVVVKRFRGGQRRGRSVDRAPKFHLAGIVDGVGGRGENRVSDIYSTFIINCTADPGDIAGEGRAGQSDNRIAGVADSSAAPVGGNTDRSAVVLEQRVGKGDRPLIEDRAAVAIGRGGLIAGKNGRAIQRSAAFHPKRTAVPRGTGVSITRQRQTAGQILMFGYQSHDTPPCVWFPGFNTGIVYKFRLRVIIQHKPPIVKRHTIFFCFLSPFAVGMLKGQNFSTICRRGSRLAETGICSAPPPSHRKSIRHTTADQVLRCRRSRTIRHGYRPAGPTRDSADNTCGTVPRRCPWLCSNSGRRSSAG